MGMKALYRTGRRMIRNLQELTRTRGRNREFSTPSNTEYWTGYNVTGHCDFVSREQSLSYMHWRNTQYLFYDELMPCAGHDAKVILDYGCGPGHDLVGFVEFSRPAKVYGLDIASTSLQEASKRLLLHDARTVELQLIHDGQVRLPFSDSSIDYIHSSGVLHHTPNPQVIVREFHRILKSSGTVRIMVYNYHCIWLHLYVAYQRRLIEKRDVGLSLEDSWKRSTDTEQCPVSRWYRKDDFLRLCTEAGFAARFVGAAIHVNEMAILPSRYPAIQDQALPREHRDFLHRLTFDKYGRPLWEGHVAGIDGVFELNK
jgi:ubiquinone/menaquinone biosynthesis C-methylase UbiE